MHPVHPGANDKGFFFAGNHALGDEVPSPVVLVNDKVGAHGRQRNLGSMANIAREQAKYDLGSREHGTPFTGAH